MDTIQQKAKKFFIRVLDYTRSKVNRLSNEDAIRKAREEDPQGFEAFQQYERKGHTSAPIPAVAHVTTSHVDTIPTPARQQAEAIPSSAASATARRKDPIRRAAGDMLVKLVEEGTDPTQATLSVKKVFYPSRDENNPNFEQLVVKAIRQGATPQQAVRSTAVLYPKLQADYFRRIHAGEYDALIDIWK